MGSSRRFRHARPPARPIDSSVIELASRATLSEDTPVGHLG
jgi:hypothetical protein